MKRLRFPQVPRSKKALIIGAATIVFIAAPSVVVGFHQLGWQAYTSENDAVYSEGRMRAEQLVSADSVSLEGLKRTTNEIDVQLARMCANEPLLTEQRAQLFEAAATERTQCQQRKEALATVRVAALRIVSYLEVDRIVASAYTATTKTLDGTKPTDYQSRQAAWEAHQAALAMAPVDEGYASLDKQKRVAKEIISAYATLIAADKAQDRTQFDAASEKLAESYRDLADTADVADSDYRKLVADLINKVQNL